MQDENRLDELQYITINGEANRCDNIFTDELIIRPLECGYQRSITIFCLPKIPQTFADFLFPWIASRII